MTLTRVTRLLSRRASEQATRKASCDPSEKSAATRIFWNGVMAQFLSIGRDVGIHRDSVLDGRDAGRRPGRSLGFLALRPGADVTAEGHPVALDLDPHLLGIELGTAAEGRLD